MSTNDSQFLSGAAHENPTGLQFLVLDDENEQGQANASLDQCITDLKAVLLQGSIASVQTVRAALDRIRTQHYDVAVFDLNMEKDDSIAWDQMSGGFLSGGFLAYFALSRYFPIHKAEYNGLLLPTIVVLYTHTPQLINTLGPFWSDFDSELLEGRPFRIVLKREGGSIQGLEKALREEERARYHQVSSQFYEPEGIVKKIDALKGFHDREEWEKLGRHKVAENLTFAKAFPVSWNRILASWDDPTKKVELIAEIITLLQERNYLRSLNLLFKPGNCLERVTHSQANIAAAYWDTTKEAVKILPKSTQEKLGEDLGCKAWIQMPWGVDYDVWQQNTAAKVHRQWRQWKADEQDCFVETVQGFVLQELKFLLSADCNRCTEQMDGRVCALEELSPIIWKGSHEIGGKPRTLYVDPHIIAEAASSEVQEINKWSYGKGISLFRVVTDLTQNFIGFDIIGVGNGGFAERLPDILKGVKFTRRDTIARLLLHGWAEVWFYTHHSGDQENVIGVNLSRPCAEENQWPHQRQGEIDWHEVDSVLRFKFSLV